MFFPLFDKSGFLTNSVVLTSQAVVLLYLYRMYAAKFTEQAENYTRLVDPSAL